MSDSRTCPQCGAILPADAPGGVCPQCVLKLGLETGPPVSVVESEAPTNVPDSRPTPSGAIDPGPTTPGGGFIPPSPEELQKHFSQLEVIELLGRGGMGAVYKARQPALDRFVALKILPPEVGRDPAFAERFTREARALAKLSHPNIVMVYDFGQSDGLYYLLMEFVDGVNLRQTIRSGAMSPEEALKIVPQICEALQFAHEEGVVHRDIKPENILLDKRGRLKIADFGLAKLLARADSAILLTQTYQVMGTLHYMAPEQFERPTSVDHRADIYSLGVVFYELLTGQLPLGRYALPSEKASIDTRLDDVVLKTLEREPEKRYQHASDVKTDLETIAHGKVPELAAAAVSREPARPRATASQPAARELSAAEWEEARRKVKGPAIGLIVAGILNLSPVLLALFVPLYYLMSIGWAPQLERPYPAEALLSLAEAVPAAVICGQVTDFSPALLALQEMPTRQLSSELRAPLWLGMMSLPLSLLSIPFGALMIIGGVKMRRLELYGLALVAAIVALLPCSPGFFIGLPIGVWALVVLLNLDVKAAFGQKPVFAEVIAEKKPPAGPAPQPPSPGDDPHDSYYTSPAIGPGNALVVTGVISILFWVAMFIVMCGTELGYALSSNNGYSPQMPILGMSVGYALAMLGSMLIVHGGLKMRSCTGFGWVMAASILAALFPPACFLGFWVGMWNFVMLSSWRVRKAFEARRTLPVGSMWRGLALLFAPPAVVLCVGAGVSLLVQASRPAPVGTILVYDVQPNGQHGEEGPYGLSRAAIAFCEARVNVGKKKLASLKEATGPGWETGGTRVEISVFGSDPVVANRIEERLAAVGKIEFAILADAESDRELIARARTVSGAEVPAANTKSDGSAEALPGAARWVAVSPRAERQLADAFGEFSHFGTRRDAKGGLEVLVIVDPQNVTEKEISLASIGTDGILSLAFNSTGAKKMRSLTSRPDYKPTAFKHRRLALLLDDTVFTTAQLNEVIADRMAISGDYTSDEANDFIALVRSGKPPGTIKQVSRKTVTK